MESYILRDYAALYHISNIRDRLEVVKQPRQSYIQEVQRAELELQFEVDALILTLNSMFDLAAHIINEVVLKPKLHDKVHLEEIRKSKSLSIIFQKRIDRLTGNHIYKKIKSYSNISKHTKAIRGQLTIDFRLDIPKISYSTDKFGLKQPMTLDVKDLEDCRKFTKKTIESLIALIATTLQSTF